MSSKPAMSVPSPVLASAAEVPFSSRLPRRFAIGFAATLFVALAAHVAFPLPFTPVPFTLQPLAVLCVGLFLGPVDGALAMVAYLAEGAAGLPVFSPTGPGGVAQMLGPTGGYLLAYPLVALICGSFRRFAAQWGPFVAALSGAILATAMLFACGAFWLAHLAHLTVSAVWIAAVAPFLPGEAVKALAAAGIFRALHPSNRAG